MYNNSGVYLDKIQLQCDDMKINKRQADGGIKAAGEGETYRREIERHRRQHVLDK